MLKNNNVNRILAVIIAIVLWAYVVGEVNPATDTVVHDVPISFTNQDVLENKGLAVLSSSEHSVNITVSGQRTIVSKAEPSDFSVVCDVSELVLGDNTVKLNVEGPSNLKIDHVSVEKITVAVDEKVTAEKPVRINVTGEVGANKEVSVIEMDQNTIVVEGPKNIVNKVTAMVAYIDAAELTESKKVFEVDAVPVDSTGTMVERVSAVSDKNVKVTALMYSTKSVNLEVPVINKESGKSSKKYTLPTTIVIKGTESALSKVDSIKCKTVDLKKIKETTSIKLKPILPDGVKVAKSSENLSMTVNVSNNKTKSIEATEANINLTGKAEGTEYKSESEKYTIEVEGDADIVEALSIEDFVITADVTDLTAGTHEVKLTVTCNKDVDKVKVTPEKITITISIS